MPPPPAQPDSMPYVLLFPLPFPSGFRPGAHNLPHYSAWRKDLICSLILSITLVVFISNRLWYYNVSSGQKVVLALSDPPETTKAETDIRISADYPQKIPDPELCLLNMEHGLPYALPACSRPGTQDRPCALR